MALVQMPVIDDIPLTLTAKADHKPLAVLLDRPSNPGNLGSIIRSCDAFGVDHLLLTGHGVDPFDPITIRATAGAFFAVSLARLSGHETLATWFAAAKASLPDLQVIGTSVKG